MFSLGAALSAAFDRAGNSGAGASTCESSPLSPVRLKLRWLHPADLDSGFTAEVSDAATHTAVGIRDGRGTLVANAEVVLKPASPAFDSEGQPERQLERQPWNRSLDSWQRDFDAALAAYRGQRAWQIMLAVRKAYGLLARGGWMRPAAFLAWLPGLLLGRPSGLDEYDLIFPKLVVDPTDLRLLAGENASPTAETSPCGPESPQVVPRDR
jgi:hypothetical protein